MQERNTKVVLGALGGLAVLIILGWYAQLRLEVIRGSDVSLDAIFREAQDTSKGMPTDDMGSMRKGIGSSGLPVLADRIPEFQGLSTWLNSEPLVAEDLKGKVVLVDFWTYSCINCIRTLPYITALNTKYADEGLLIIGVHTPEFAFEKDVDNVRDAIARHGIEYPVALDNDFRTWNAFNNRYWPAKYLFDAEGRLRYTHFGEGDYDVTERAVQALLEEAGMAVEDSGVIQVEDTVDFSKIGTPEIYIGYRRLEAFGSPEPVLRDQVRMYSTPDDLERNLFYLDGSWRIGAEAAWLDGGEGSITLKYVASNANLVMGSDHGGVSVEVTLDGAPVPEGYRGKDIVVREGKTMMTVDDERLYDIIGAEGRYEEHVLKLRFLVPGVRMYAWTFG